MIEYDEAPINPKDFPSLEIALNDMESGPEKEQACQEAILAADIAEDHYYRMKFRYELIYSYMDTDPAKTLPITSEYVQIYEDHPFSRGNWCDEAVLISLAYSIVNAKGVPEVSLKSLDPLINAYLDYANKFNAGMFTYWYILFRLNEYKDTSQALKYAENMLEEGKCDIGYPDCEGCALSEVIGAYLRTGQREKADIIAHAIEVEDVELCENAVIRYCERYLDHALDNGDMQLAHEYAGKIADIELSYIPPSLLRYCAYIKPSVPKETMENMLEHLLSSFDEEVIYAYFKAFWVTCRQLAKKGKAIKANLPESFELYREDGLYDMEEVAHWFEQKCTVMARKFDEQNESDYFIHNLNMACACDNVPIIEFPKPKVSHVIWRTGIMALKHLIG